MAWASEFEPRVDQCGLGEVGGTRFTGGRPMKNGIARLFIVSPMIVIYFCHETYRGMLSERVSPTKWLMATTFCLLVLWIWDANRKPPRTLPSSILTRMLISSMVVFSIVLLFGASLHYWYILSHATVWMIAWLQLTVHRFGHHFVYHHDPNGNYFRVRQAGWHPFWDRLPTIFNPDSDFIRNGGRPTPGR